MATSAQGKSPTAAKSQASEFHTYRHPLPHKQTLAQIRILANSFFQIVDLASLPTAQLNQVKNQLTDELQHLTNSFQQLKTAQIKFRDCGNSVRDGLKRGEGTTPQRPIYSLFISLRNPQNKKTKN